MDSKDNAVLAGIDRHPPKHERYEQYTKLLKEICKEKFLSISHKKINDGYQFNYVTINGNREFKKTLVFSAGIHGEEPAGPYAVMRFLKDYKEVDPSIRIVLFPIVNPYGFDRGQRFNAFRQDINRRFCDKLLAGEAKCVTDVLKKVKPDLFVSLHEWKAKDGFYMYASNHIQKEEIVKIPKLAVSKGFKLMNKKINGEECNGGLIWHPQEPYKDDMSRCTLENKMYNDGVHYICIETPSNANIDKRIGVQVDIMHFIVDKLLKENNVKAK